MRLVPFFNPRSISGCQLWLDGADPNGTGVLPTNGSTVSSWIDKSGNARNLTGSGTPTFLSGGGINFNGTNAFYTNTNFAYNLSIRSVFLVAKLNTYLQYAGFITFIPNPSSGVDQNSITGMSVETASSAALSFNQNLSGASPVYSSVLTATLTNVNLYNDNMNGTIGSGFVNGNAITNVTTATTAGTTSGFGVGTRWQGSMSLSYLFSGNIYDIILYTGPLTTSQRQQVEGYLAWKWGLQGSLPSNHPFKVNPLSSLIPVAIPRPIGLARLFLPTQISNCVLWMDAADTGPRSMALNSAGTVVSWFSKANTNTLGSLGTLVRKGSIGTNQLPTISISYNAQPVFTNVLGFGGNTAQTTVMVGIVPSNANNTAIGIIRYLTAGGGNAFPLSLGSDLRYNSFSSYQNQGGATVTLTTTTRAQMGFSIQNGSTQFTFESGTAGGTANYTLNQIDGRPRISYFGTGATGNSELGELIIFSKALNTAERQQVEGYLAWKWGLVANLPSTHPYKNSPLGAQSPPLSLPQIMRAAFRPIVTRFTYTGAAQTYTVPANTSLIYVYLWGAGGGRDANLTGAGAFVSGTVNVSPGATYSIVVGKNGNTNGTVRGTMAQGGGGLGQYSYFGGGGFSGIFSGASLVIGSLVAIAGGGGTASFSRLGGSGGVITGGSGSSTNGGYPGTGGTQTAGGTTLPGTFTVTYGEQFFGGAGRIEGPGGGGGYYGGGGSDCRFQPGQLYAGSGGGSSFTGGFASILETADGAVPNGSTTTQPGGTTNQYYVSPWGQGLQHGYAVIVTLAP